MFYLWRPRKLLITKTSPRQQLQFLSKVIITVTVSFAACDWSPVRKDFLLFVAVDSVLFSSCLTQHQTYKQKQNLLDWTKRLGKDKCRDVLFEFHLKFSNTASIGIPVRSLLLGRQTSTYLVQLKKEQLLKLNGIQIKHL